MGNGDDNVIWLVLRSAGPAGGRGRQMHRRTGEVLNARVLEPVYGVTVQAVHARGCLQLVFGPGAGGNVYC